MTGELISGANSIVATFGLYSGDPREVLTIEQLWRERSAEADSIDVFRGWFRKAVRVGLIEEGTQGTYHLTSKGLQRMQFLNRMIEEYPDTFGSIGFDID